ncbi:MAG: beta-L-arabinofuranosidase domain-containing protein [Lentisphaeria bacterium]
MKKMLPIPIQTARLQDLFLAPRVALNHQVTLPSCLEHCRKTGRLDAFLLNWRPGQPNKPHIYWDSDVAKVVEGMAWDLMLFPDAERACELDQLAQRIVSAQQPDGYLNTWFTVVEPQNRWQKLYLNHELYCAGHLMEAATAHFQATGKRFFLEAMCRNAECLSRTFGRKAGQLRGYPGHPEIERALCKLAESANRPDFFELASFFIEERGQSPNYFCQEIEREGGHCDPEYFANLLAHKPLRQQSKATGHAVRAMYLYSAMAELAEKQQDKELMTVCEKLWDSVTLQNMYVTGGIGSSEFGEQFTKDYHLPNAAAYAESCAAIGLMMFASRMLNISGNAGYAEILERVLFNAASSGYGLDGKTFFYANLLEVDQNMFTKRKNITAERQPWFNTSCCPTNFCRILPQLACFLFSQLPDGMAIHIPVAASIDLPLPGRRLKLQISSEYPYQGDIEIRVLEDCPQTVLALRIPAWAPKFAIRLNGDACPDTLDNGYLIVQRDWRKGDFLQLQLAMPVECLQAHPKVTENAGRIALRRGPLVYALESIDNGEDLCQILISPKTEFKLEQAHGLPQGTLAIAGTAFREHFTPESSDQLYAARKSFLRKFRFTAIPYALWQNRGPASMRVWIRAMTEPGILSP